MQRLYHNVQRLRLFRDLDAELGATGETGGILEKICITRGKNRFGKPTSGGWADIMLKFYFVEDEGVHICEVQLVHGQLFTVRKNMGAHKTYSIFRAALELLEMLGFFWHPWSGLKQVRTAGAHLWGNGRENWRAFKQKLHH